MRSTHRRIDELLLLRALEGLDTEQTQELEALLAVHADVDTASYDKAAAVVALAACASLPPMPERLRARLERRASEFIEERRGTMRD